MVRVAPHDSTDQEENQEEVLEEDCHKAFLSLNVLSFVQTPGQRAGCTPAKAGGFEQFYTSRTRLAKRLASWANAFASEGKRSAKSGAWTA